jgi:translation elongation factor EF-1alpha
MDSTSPSWSQARFYEIESKVKELLSHLKVNPNNVLSIPTSGLSGGNLVARPAFGPGEEDALSWYTGPTLWEALDNLQAPERCTTGSLRAVLTSAPLIADLTNKKCEVGVHVLRGHLRTGRSVGIPRGQHADSSSHVLSSEQIDITSHSSLGGIAVAVVSKIVDNCGMPVPSLEAGCSGIITVESRWESRVFVRVCYDVTLLLEYQTRQELRKFGISEWGNLVQRATNNWMRDVVPFNDHHNVEFVSTCDPGLHV